jgi:hypothetical protein
VSDFPAKQFLGQRYEFAHLQPFEIALQLGLDDGTLHQLAVQISFSTHCFTEAFDPVKHQDHHRYNYRQELRAFDLQRYSCSLSLPSIIQNLPRCKVYRASNSNYTYVAQLQLEGVAQPYSLFFQFKPQVSSARGVLKMYVQSAYLSPLKTAKNAQSWRFIALAGSMAGVYGERKCKQRPKKKTP